MYVSLSAVIFCIVFKVNLSLARLPYMIEDKVKVPCENSQQCEEIGYKGYACVEGVCLCEDKKMCQNMELPKTVTKIGQTCTLSSDCFIEQSFCNEKGKCDCINNTVSSNNKRTCLNESYSLGLSCEEDVQCIPLNGVCKSQRCICPSSMHADKGICFKNVELGYPCQQDEECSLTDFSSCKTNKCSCDRKYIKAESSSKCLLKARDLASACSEHIQCTSLLGFGSMCYKGFCTCKELFHHKVDINKCVIDLRGTCQNHSDCHQPGGGESRLKCILGECKCKPDYFEDAGFCVMNSSKDNLSVSLRYILPYAISYLFCYIIL